MLSSDFIQISINMRKLHVHKKSLIFDPTEEDICQRVISSFSSYLK